MSSKTDAARLVVLLDTIKRERERRGVRSTPIPVTKSAIVKPPTQLASGSPAVIDHYRANIGLAYLQPIIGTFSEILVVDTAKHESGPKLSQGDTLPGDMIRDSVGRRDPTSSAPRDEDTGTD